MTREKHIIYVCWDCMSYIAGHGDEDWADGRPVSEIAKRVEANWSEWTLLCGGDTSPERQDEQAEDPYFSWSHCEGCDSSLGGDRHGVLAYRDVHDLKLLAEVAG